MGHVCIQTDDAHTTADFFFLFHFPLKCSKNDFLLKCEAVKGLLLMENPLNYRFLGRWTRFIRLLILLYGDVLMDYVEVNGFRNYLKDFNEICTGLWRFLVDFWAIREGFYLLIKKLASWRVTCHILRPIFLNLRFSKNHFEDGQSINWIPLPSFYSKSTKKLIFPFKSPPAS